MIATCGWQRRTSSTALPASAVRPTTFTYPLEAALRMNSRPAENSSWSSTMTTVSGFSGETEPKASRFSVLRFDPSDRIAMFDAGCRASVDGRPGLVHLELGWTKDYVAHQIAARRSIAAVGRR